MKRLWICLLLCFPMLGEGHPPWGIAINEQGTVFIPDILHHGRGCLFALLADRELSVLAKDFHAHNVNLDAQGYPISAHGEETHTMIRFGKNGKRDTLIHTTNLDDFFGGNACYSPNGNIYFLNQHRVWQLLPNGSKQQFNDHVIVWSQAIYVDQKERIYLPDIGEGKGKLYRLTKNGASELLADNLLTKTPDYDRHNDVLLGMYVNKQDDVFICETAGKRVICIDASGTVSTYYHESSGWTPCGITFFKNEAYILEYDTRKSLKGPRIVKLDANGRSSVYFDYDSYQPPAQRKETPFLPQVDSPKPFLPVWVWIASGFVLVVVSVFLGKSLVK